MCRFLSELHKKVLVMPFAALAILAASVGSLVTALIAQYFFDVAPCILCLYQRVPYVIAAILAVSALLVRSNDKRARCLLGIIALAFFINAGIAVFHSGVELQWWKGTESCGVNPLVMQEAGLSPREMLLKTPTVSCDQINFTVFGFTMANWNILASLGLALFALLASLGPCINWAKAKCGCCCGSDKKCG